MEILKDNKKTNEYNNLISWFKDNIFKKIKEEKGSLEIYVEVIDDKTNLIFNLYPKRKFGSEYSYNISINEKINPEDICILLELFNWDFLNCHYNFPYSTTFSMIMDMLDKSGKHTNKINLYINDNNDYELASYGEYIINRFNDKYHYDEENPFEHSYNILLSEYLDKANIEALSKKSKQELLDILTKCIYGIDEKQLINVIMSSKNKELLYYILNKSLVDTSTVVKSKVKSLKPCSDITKEVLSEYDENK